MTRIVNSSAARSWGKWRRLAGPWVAIGMTACVAGCSGLRSHAPATQVYMLRAAPPVQAGSAQSDAAPTPASSLRVQRPLAGPGLSSDHIVLVQSDHRMSFYQGSRWPADLPDVVEALAVDTLRTAGNWTTVQDSSSAFTSEYLLQIVIRSFEADYTNGSEAPEAHVVLDCSVGRRTSREVLMSFVAQGSATARANRLSEVVAAFEVASAQALAIVAERSAQALQGATQNNPRRE